MDEHYTLLGLAHPRTPWPAQLSSLANNGAAPIDYLSCLTGDEVRALLSAGPVVSAVLLDASSPHVDRDLIAAVTAAGAAAIGVDSPRSTPEWLNLGCQAHLSEDFTKDDLLSAIKRHSQAPVVPVGPRHSTLSGASSDSRGSLIGVFGAGGAGSTSVAMALSQGFAAVGNPTAVHSAPGDPAPGDPTAGVGNQVVLVDGVRRGDLAMYHHIGDIYPGLPEVAGSYRTGTADPDSLRSLAHPVESRSYDLILGLRRPSDWTALPSAATRAGVNGLRHTYRRVIVETDCDLDSEQSTGSADVGARHFMSIELANTADAICLVGDRTMKGLNDLANLFAELVAAGADPTRVMVVFNRSSRSPATRNRLNSTLARLVAMDSALQPAAVLHVPEIRGLERIHRDVHRMPEGVCSTLTRSALRLAREPRTPASTGSEYRVVLPGELGSTADRRPPRDRRVA